MICRPTKAKNHEVKRLKGLENFFGKYVYFCYTCRTWWFRKIGVKQK